MSVILKRVQKNKSGGYTYRRKLPQDVQRNRVKAGASDGLDIGPEPTRAAIHQDR